MAYGLSDPLTMLSFSSMPIEELCAHHRFLLAALRDADHWRRLITARIDLAVAAVAGLGELEDPPPALAHCLDRPAPAGLRALVGVAGESSGTDLRLHETTLLTQLRSALGDLDDYCACLRAVTSEAANVIAARVGSIQIAV